MEVSFSKPLCIQKSPSFQCSHCKKEKPEYLTRERTPEELAVINSRKKRALILTGSCVTGGLVSCLVYLFAKIRSTKRI